MTITIPWYVRPFTDPRKTGENDVVVSLHLATRQRGGVHHERQPSLVASQVEDSYIESTEVLVALSSSLHFGPTGTLVRQGKITRTYLTRYSESWDII